MTHKAVEGAQPQIMVVVLLARSQARHPVSLYLPLASHWHIRQALWYIFGPGLTLSC